MNKIYLLLGPDFASKQHFIKQLRDSLSDPETYTYYAPELDVFSIITLLQTESMFHDHLLVCIRAADKIPDQKSLRLLLSSQFHPRAFLIFLSEEIKLSSLLETSVPPENKKIFWEIFPEQRVTWIMQYVESRGGRIEKEAAQIIAQLVAGSPSDFAEVLDQLIVLKINPIREEQVDAHVIHSKKETIFSLFESLGDKNLFRALQVLHTLLLQRESTGRILYWLQSQYRKLRQLSQLLIDGLRQDEALQRVGIRGRNYQASCLKIAHESKMDHALLLFSETDVLMRTQPEHEHTLILELLMYHLIQGTQRSLSFTYQKMQLFQFV